MAYLSGRVACLLLSFDRQSSICSSCCWRQDQDPRWGPPPLGYISLSELENDQPHRDCSSSPLRPGGHGDSRISSDRGLAMVQVPLRYPDDREHHWRGTRKDRKST